MLTCKGCSNSKFCERKEAGQDNVEACVWKVPINIMCNLGCNRDYGAYAGKNNYGE